MTIKTHIGEVVRGERINQLLDGVKGDISKLSEAEAYPIVLLNSWFSMATLMHEQDPEDLIECMLCDYRMPHGKPGAFVMYSPLEMGNDEAQGFIAAICPRCAMESDHDILERAAEQLAGEGIQYFMDDPGMSVQ